MPGQVCVLSRSSLLLTCIGCLEIDEEQLDRSRWRSVGEEQVHISPVSCFVSNNASQLIHHPCL